WKVQDRKCSGGDMEREDVAEAQAISGADGAGAGGQREDGCDGSGAAKEMKRKAAAILKRLAGEVRVASIAWLAWSVMALAGCQSTPRPAPGMAALRVRVIAEPKAGTKSIAESVSVYDGAPTSNNLGVGAFERVNYSE